MTDGERSHVARAVGRLLEEKEKDLELAARIGQSLLERSKELQLRNEFLEDRLAFSNEQVTQLKHELQMKIDLLHMYIDDEAVECGRFATSSERSANVDRLKRKVIALEDENGTLKTEIIHLKSLTIGLEEKEQSLLQGVLRQLADAKSQIDALSESLAQKSHEMERQQQDIASLRAQVSVRQAEVRSLTNDSDDLLRQLRAAQDTQQELTQELIDLQERYAEVLGLYHETLEELKAIRDERVLIDNGNTFYDSNYDSLQSELDASDSGYSCGPSPMQSARGPRSLRTRKSRNQVTTVMELARGLRAIDVPTRDENGSELVPASPRVAGGDVRLTSTPRLAADAPGEPLQIPSALQMLHCGSRHRVPSGSRLRLSRSVSSESLCSNVSPREIGVPGVPGSRDLEVALKRLALRREVERDYQAHRSARLQQMSSTATLQTPCVQVWPASPTADVSSASSGISTGSPREAAFSPARSGGTALLKVELVKLMRGSQTLQHWKALATPSLTSVLHKSPGVLTRGDSNAGEVPTSAFLADTSLACDVDDDVDPGGVAASSELSFCRQLSSTPKAPLPELSPRTTEPTFRPHRRPSARLSKHSSVPDLSSDEHRVEPVATSSLFAAALDFVNQAFLAPFPLLRLSYGGADVAKGDVPKLDVDSTPGAGLVGLLGGSRDVPLSVAKPCTAVGNSRFAACAASSNVPVTFGRMRQQGVVLRSDLTGTMSPL